MKNRVATLAMCLFVFLCLPIRALEWRTAWTTAAQGPFPNGYPQGQPDLSFAFPNPEAGAEDQSFRMIVRPDIWGDHVRVRFTNVFGTKPLVIDGAYVGLHMNSAAVVKGTNQPVRFGSDARVVIPPGEWAWSDPVDLPFVKELGSGFLYGRKLAVSFHVPGTSGPMTWHALANSVNYVSWPKAGSTGRDEGEKSFPFSANSWFLIDAVDMTSSVDAGVIVCFGDSITDGHMSSLNGDDRWPDAYSRIAKAKYGNRISIVNSGICGNQILGPAEYTAENPFGGGPSAFDRADRDILSLSGVSAVIWLEGINDLHEGRTARELAQGMRDLARYLKERNPDLLLIGATLVSCYGSPFMNYGSDGIDGQRRELNEFIRTSDIFDAVIDFDTALLDPETGGMQAVFAPDSAFGGPGDFLHPNRAGYKKMAETAAQVEF